MAAAASRALPARVWIRMYASMMTDLLVRQCRASPRSVSPAVSDHASPSLEIAEFFNSIHSEAPMPVVRKRAWVLGDSDQEA